MKRSHSSANDDDEVYICTLNELIVYNNKNNPNSHGILCLVNGIKGMKIEISPLQSFSCYLPQERLLATSKELLDCEEIIFSEDEEENDDENEDDDDEDDEKINHEEYYENNLEEEEDAIESKDKTHTYNIILNLGEKTIDEILKLIYEQLIENSNSHFSRDIFQSLPFSSLPESISNLLTKYFNGDQSLFSKLINFAIMLEKDKKLFEALELSLLSLKYSSNLMEKKKALNLALRLIKYFQLYFSEIILTKYWLKFFPSDITQRLHLSYLLLSSVHNTSDSQLQSSILSEALALFDKDILYHNRDSISVNIAFTFVLGCAGKLLPYHIDYYIDESTSPFSYANNGTIDMNQLKYVLSFGLGSQNNFSQSKFLTHSSSFLECLSHCCNKGIGLTSIFESEIDSIRSHLLASKITLLIINNSISTSVNLFYFILFSSLRVLNLIQTKGLIINNTNIFSFNQNKKKKKIVEIDFVPPVERSLNNILKFPFLEDLCVRSLYFLSISFYYLHKKFKVDDSSSSLLSDSHYLLMNALTCLELADVFIGHSTSIRNKYGDKLIDFSHDSLNSNEIRIIQNFLDQLREEQH